MKKNNRGSRPSSKNRKKKSGIPSGLPDYIIQKGNMAASDNDTYQWCMKVIKARIFTIDRLISHQIDSRYAVFQIELIYFQFRMLIEMLYLTAIVSRKKKFDEIWNRSDSEHRVAEIRKRLGDDLEDYFPYPFKFIENNYFSFFDRPISEK